MCDGTQRGRLQSAGLRRADIHFPVWDRRGYYHSCHNIRNSPPKAILEHGGTYTDPITGKPRQFDYRCSLTTNAARLSLAVECKNLTSPLILCGIERPLNEAFHDLIESTKIYRAPDSEVSFGCTSATRRAKNKFYKAGEFVAKSLLRTQSDKSSIKPPPERERDSDIYERWAQAVSSAVELAETACRSATGLPKRNKTLLTAILPIVVVPNGQMWSLTYDDRAYAEFVAKVVLRLGYLPNIRGGYWHGIKGLGRQWVGRFFF